MTHRSLANLVQNAYIDAMLFLTGGFCESSASTICITWFMSLDEGAIGPHHYTFETVLGTGNGTEHINEPSWSGSPAATLKPSIGRPR